MNKVLIELGASILAGMRDKNVERKFHTLHLMHHNLESLTTPPRFLKRKKKQPCNPVFLSDSYPSSVSCRDLLPLQVYQPEKRNHESVAAACVTLM